MPGLYVYGVVTADGPRPDRLPGAVGDQPADTVCWIGADDLPVAAVTSPAPDDLRGKRRDLIAHQQVLERLAETGPVLPMRFGMVAAEEPALLANLRAEADRYRRLLAELAGRVEFNLKATPDEDQFVASAAREPAVQAALRTARRGGSADRQLQLGEAVANAVADRRKRVADQLLAKLDPLVDRSAALATGEQHLLNAAFLVERSQVGPFTDQVAQLRERLVPAVELVLTGPLPPYSFVGN